MRIWSARPEATARRLLPALGLPADPEVIASFAAAADTSSVGKYRRQPERKQTEALEVLHPTLASFGYADPRAVRARVCSRTCSAERRDIPWCSMRSRPSAPPCRRSRTCWRSAPLPRTGCCFPCRRCTVRRGGSGSGWMARSTAGSYQLLHADAHDLSMFADAGFGLVLCNSLLEHDPHFWLTLAEARRVLAPGGWMVLGVPGYGAMGRIRLPPPGRLIARMLAHLPGVGAAWRDLQPALDASSLTLGVHNFPGDYYRFSARAMAEVLLAGLEAGHGAQHPRPAPPDWLRPQAVGRRPASRALQARSTSSTPITVRQACACGHCSGRARQQGEQVQHPATTVIRGPVACQTSRRETPEKIQTLGTASAPARCVRPESMPTKIGEIQHGGDIGDVHSLGQVVPCPRRQGGEDDGGQGPFLDAAEDNDVQPVPLHQRPRQLSQPRDRPGAQRCARTGRKHRVGPVKERLGVGLHQAAHRHAGRTHSIDNGMRQHRHAGLRVHRPSVAKAGGDLLGVGQRDVERGARVAISGEAGAHPRRDRGEETAGIGFMAKIDGQIEGAHLQQGLRIAQSAPGGRAERTAARCATRKSQTPPPG